MSEELEKEASARFAVGAEYTVPMGEIEERRTWPSFAVTRTTRGIVFETYTGYHVWTTPYVVGVNQDVRAKSLHAWLSLLLEVASKADEAKDALYPGLPAEDAMTYGQLLEAMRIITETNMLHPVTAFVDEGRAAEYSTRYIDWLKERAAQLQDAMTALPADEDTELRANALMERETEVREVVGGMLEGVGDV